MKIYIITSIFCVETKQNLLLNLRKENPIFNRRKRKKKISVCKGKGTDLLLSVHPWLLLHSNNVPNNIKFPVCLGRGKQCQINHCICQ